MKKPATCKGCPLEDKGQGFSTPSGGFAKNVLFVGEALSKGEALTGKPFQGLPGWQLDMLCARAGLVREDDVVVDNVIHCHPPEGKLSRSRYEFNAINHCRSLLDDTIERTQPKAIVALGGIPMRRLAGTMGIARYRGFVLDGPHGIPVVPTFHPNYLLPKRKQKSSAKWTGPVISDIRKAVRLARDGFTRRKPNYLLDPHPDIAMQFAGEHEQTKDCYLSWDIETPYKMASDESDLKQGDHTTIFRISFSFKVGHAISVPWTERWMPFIVRMLQCNRPMVGWNAKAFDVPKVEEAGVSVIGDVHDGMNLFHVWLPNLPRKLEFVTSLCSDHHLPWKHLNVAEPALYNAIDSDAALENFLHIKRMLQR